MLHINVDGIYGSGKHESAEYPSLRELLAEMDRLGIWGVVAANAYARDGHALEGNRQLMSDIAALPGARQRVIPAFTISTKTFLEPETLGYLTEKLENGEVGIVSVYPKTGNYPIHVLERTFKLIRKYKPVVLVSVYEMNDFKALADFAAIFPEIKFIVQCPMWPQYAGLFDAMWRRPNIFVDASHLHVRYIYGTVEKYLGRGRTVFGIGYRAIAGAPIAALAYAEIDRQSKSDIASGTLLKLLPNRGYAERFIAEAKELSPKVGNSLWSRFLEGGGLKDVEVIDAHGHLGSSPAGWYIPETDLRGQIESLVRSMDALGIDQMIASGEKALSGYPVEGNAAVEKATESFRGRFLGYYAYHPLHEREITGQILDESFAGGYFVGFKTLADYWMVPVTDPSYVRCWEYAQKHRLPILFHSWEGRYDTPEQIASVARRYPDAAFLIGHSGGGDTGRAQAVAACNDLPNVYLEFCGSFCARTSWEDTLSRIDPRKVVFGTDTMAHDQAWELGRLLSCDAGDDVLRLILAQNMKRILARRI